MRTDRRARPLRNVDELLSLPMRGDQALVSARLDGNTGPHKGAIEAVLPSGRIVMLIRRGTRSWRLITEPANVYPLIGENLDGDPS